MNKNQRSTAGFYAALTLIGMLSLWLRGAFPVVALADAGHDDLLFVRMAAYIGMGNWLGDYNNLTHSKGAAYPIFLLLNHASGLPVKFTEHAIYLAAALFLSSLIGKVYGRRLAFIASFVLLAFMPVAWNPETGGRIVREGFYVGLGVFLFALAVQCFVLSKSESVVQEFRQKRVFLVLLGFAAGVYWLTREEGIWLLPSLAILVFYWFWTRRAMVRPWRTTALFMALPLLPALLTVGAIDSVNYFKYGVFRNNDFRAADFQAAYGALSRIKHDEWRRYVVFPKDARSRAYAFSPAATELQPFFEGSAGEFWRYAGCTQTATVPCPEILSGWFMWALRDAVEKAGHYRSAPEAQSFYLRLASEINGACDQHPGECGPQRQSMVPPWRGHYLMDTARASGQIFGSLATMGGAPVGIGASRGAPRELALFALVTNNALAPLEPSAGSAAAPDFGLTSPRDAVRVRVAEALAKATSKITTFGLPAALGLWLVWLVMAVLRRRVDAGLAIASALVAAVGARVLLLGFLEATSIPSNNMLYLLPVVPMALALLPTVLFGFLAFLKK